MIHRLASHLSTILSGKRFSVEVAKYSEAAKPREGYHVVIDDSPQRPSGRVQFCIHSYGGREDLLELRALIDAALEEIE